MNAAVALRDRRLRGLGVVPMRLRARDADFAMGTAVPNVIAAVAPVESPPAAVRITRLALQPDPAALRDPAVNAMYSALTVAVPKAGLQPVRVCDVADDPAAAVLVFGTAQPPEGVPALRVLRADPLAVLHADRERKRLLWERLQTLGRGEGG